jgi:hypothetical protein
MAALPEPAMRRVAMGEWIRAEETAVAVEALTLVLRLGRSGAKGPYPLALLAFAAALGTAEDLPYEVRRDLYGRAKDRGHEDLAQLFLSALEPPSAPKNAGAELALRGRPLTLGERKQLARGGRRDLIDRLLRDPDPQVIRLLLANPRLIEGDVVVIASRRPTLPEIQREVFAARRWIARYRIKRTLVLNPHTPTDLAVRLLGFLRDGDLRMVAEDAELTPPVREAAFRILTCGRSPAPRRSGGPD